MNAKSRQKANTCTAKVEGEMTIYTAAEIKPTLIALLDGCNEAELDLSQVSEIDSAGLQLLLLTKREASEAGKQLRFVRHSPAVVECLDLCNLAAVFGDQVILPNRG